MGGGGAVGFVFKSAKSLKTLAFKSRLMQKCFIPIALSFARFDARKQFHIIFVWLPWTGQERPKSQILNPWL